MISVLIIGYKKRFSSSFKNAQLSYDECPNYWILEAILFFI